MTPEDIKAIAETVALASAALFFIYKLVAGYLYVELSVALTTTRTHIDPANDLLVITAKLKKGSRGSIRIHDAQARVVYDGTVKLVQFIGIHRLSYVSGKLGSTDRKSINWNISSKSSPLLRLPPNEETEFSCSTQVPRTAICEIEIAILGRERSWFGIGQWKASNVSAPMA